MIANQGILPEEHGKVAVVMGGWAAEREVSLKSGAAVLAGLRRCGVDAHGIELDHSLAQRLTEGAFDRVFVMVHGRGGEDGVLQGALEVLGLPYTGSGVLASAVSMDKRRTKMLWQAEGLPTPASRMIGGEADLGEVAAEVGFPLIIKPVHEGSSLGMGRAGDLEELRAAWREAREFDPEVLAERWIEGNEYTAAVVGRELLPLIRLETPRSFYDYKAKYYEDSGTRYICPCGLDSEVEAGLQVLALQAFDAVSAEGWGRVDFILDQHGAPELIEVNTVPGMTDHSLVPMAAAEAGIEFDELLLRILEGAYRRGLPDTGEPR